MRDRMKFINHIGEIIEFGKNNILINENDFRNYEWTYESKNSKITGFKRGIPKKSLPVTIWGDNARETANNIHDILEKDVVEGIPGKMYIGDYYLSGYFYAGDSSEYTQQKRIVYSMKFVVDNDIAWTKQFKREFLPRTRSEEQKGLDFPTDFEFDFAEEQLGHETLNVDHYAPNHFQMIVYGPCVDPIVYINEYPYQINTTLKESEYLIIDSRKHEVMKYLANGTVEDIYNSREFANSVFEMIPSGKLSINWSGAFGFDIILFLERSEPKW